MTFEFLIDAFDSQVAGRPDSLALVATERIAQTVRRATWSQLATSVESRAKGMRADSRLETRMIVVESDNSFDQIIDVLATMRLGKTEISIDAAMHARMANQIAKNRHGRCPLIDQRAALVLFSSGTTARPKGVVLGHTGMFGNADAKLAAVPQSIDDVRLMVLPMSHAYARTCDFGTWLISGCTLAAAQGFRGIRALAPIVRPTLMNVVPSLAYRLLDEDLAKIGLDRLRLLGCGGAAISCDAFDQWKRRGVTVIQGYGLTESGPVICSATPDNATAGLVGGFVNGWEHRIRGGELCVRGPHTMKGYWNDPAATTAKIDSEGWLRTGDLVQRAVSTGQLRVLGRVDDVIVMDNGRKISPSLVEQDLQRIVDVKHALLIFRSQLELWIDGSGDDQLIRETLQRHSIKSSIAINRFDPPLSVRYDEITSKGSVRRTQVIHNRWPR